MPGWLMGLSVGLGYEAWALAKERETLSAAVWRVRRTRYRWALWALWAGLTYHFLFEEKDDA